MSITAINPQAFAKLCKEGKQIDLIDVRTPVEFREVHVEIARNVPLDQLDPAAFMQNRNGSTNEPLYLICRSGSRGQQAYEKLFHTRQGATFDIDDRPSCRPWQNGHITGAPSAHCSRVARDGGLGPGLVRPSGIHRVICIRRSRSCIRRDHRFLRNGYDPGPNAVEPMNPRLHFMLRPLLAKEPAKFHILFDASHPQLPWSGVLTGLMVMHITIRERFNSWCSGQSEGRPVGTARATRFSRPSPELWSRPVIYGLVGLVMAGLVGGILSTIDSMMNSTATSQILPVAEVPRARRKWSRLFRPPRYAPWRCRTGSAGLAAAG